MMKQRLAIVLMGIGLLAGLLLGSAAVDRVLTLAVVASMLLAHTVSLGREQVATAPSRDGVVRK